MNPSIVRALFSWPGDEKKLSTFYMKVVSTNPTQATSFSIFFHQNDYFCAMQHFIRIGMLPLKSYEPPIVRALRFHGQEMRKNRA